MRESDYATPAYDEKARTLGWRPVDGHQWYRRYDPDLDNEWDDEDLETGNRIILAFCSKDAVDYDMAGGIYEFTPTKEAPYDQ